MRPKSNPQLPRTSHGSNQRFPDLEAAKKVGAKDTEFKYDGTMTHWIVNERKKGPMKGSNKKGSGKGERY